jgi:hypothetical protein
MTPEQQIKNLANLVHWILILVVIGVAMIAYDTDVVYHLAQIVNSL